jgi:hypothetical protein
MVIQLSNRLAGVEPGIASEAQRLQAFEAVGRFWAENQDCN